MHRKQVLLTKAFQSLKQEMIEIRAENWEQKSSEFSFSQTRTKEGVNSHTLGMSPQSTTNDYRE